MWTSDYLLAYDLMFLCSTVIILVFFIVYDIIVFSIPPPLSPLCPAPTTLQHSPRPLVHVHGLYMLSSLSSVFPIPFFISPRLFYAY